MRNDSSCLNTYPIARSNFMMLRRKSGSILSLKSITDRYKQKSQPSNKRLLDSQLAFRNKDRQEIRAEALPEARLGLCIKPDFLAIFHCDPLQLTLIGQ